MMAVNATHLFPLLLVVFAGQVTAALLGGDIMGGAAALSGDANADIVEILERPEKLQAVQYVEKDKIAFHDPGYPLALGLQQMVEHLSKGSQNLPESLLIGSPVITTIPSQVFTELQRAQLSNGAPSAVESTLDAAIVSLFLHAAPQHTRKARDTPEFKVKGGKIGVRLFRRLSRVVHGVAESSAFTDFLSKGGASPRDATAFSQLLSKRAPKLAGTKFAELDLLSRADVSARAGLFQIWAFLFGAPGDLRLELYTAASARATIRQLTEAIPTDQDPATTARDLIAATESGEGLQSDWPVVARRHPWLRAFSSGYLYENHRPVSIRMEGDVVSGIVQMYLPPIAYMYWGFEPETYLRLG